VFRRYYGTKHLANGPGYGSYNPGVPYSGVQYFDKLPGKTDMEKIQGYVDQMKLYPGMNIPGSFVKIAGASG
jgi:hypothetical protein